MSKFKGMTMLALMFSVAWTGTASAQTTEPVEQDFFITAEIPAASSVDFVVSEVTPGEPPTFASVETNQLTFDMDFIGGDVGIYLPTTFFAVDVAPQDGAGNPSVLIEYLDTENPNDAVGGEGLGNKGLATVVRVEGVQGSQTEFELEQETYAVISGTTISAAQLTGGFMRMYLGICSGEAGQPAACEPFTNADQPGFYRGTITLSATVSGA